MFKRDGIICMHDYSIDRHPKEKILFLLAFAAIWFAPKLNSTIATLATDLGVGIGWSSPSITAIPVMGLFSITFLLFDRCLWKIKWFRKILLVPDLNGKWQCLGQTTLKDGVATQTDWEGEFTITQSWSKIFIHMNTDNSQSKSISASLFHEVGVGYRLLYQYNNDPTATHLDLSKHSGSSEILFSENCVGGKGYYFTDQHRRTVGTLSLERK